MKCDPEDHRQAADATAESPINRAFRALDSNFNITIREGANLPHWTQTGVTYAVNFRLADSLPEEVLADWNFERRNIFLVARQQGRELTDVEYERLAKLFSEEVESYLDAGHGNCWMRDNRIAEIVREALLRFEHQRYELDAWCIMPNHVHAVVRPIGQWALSEILQTWKSFTAKEANRILDRTGAFWQSESYDHLIRDEDDLRNQIRYVLENPLKAGLQDWGWISAAQSGIGGSPMSHRQAADATTEV